MTAALTIRDFALLTAEESSALFDAMTPQERASKLYDWQFWARPEQLLPEGDWIYWLILAGRGTGKTRVGGETVRQWIKAGFNYVNLIAATHDDLRSIMIEGESGLLACCPPDERPRYVANARELRWPNGAKSLVFSAEEPDRLRGKQHMKIWADELAAWRYPDAWDQAMFGLRLGDKPQAIVTTTPRPTKIIREMVKDERTFITRGSTYDNVANLAEAFLRKIVSKYAGTRLGRQELDAEILEDVPGALFTRDNIDRNRVSIKPDNLRRVVVAIDPAVSTGENADETGIVVCGIDDRNPPHGYVLDDVSGIYAPSEWARKALHMYHKHKADRIVGEINQGGDMVEATIRMFNANVPFKGVHAMRGKVLRAEPVSGLYEQNRIHHVGTFAVLEDQLCLLTPDFDKKVSGYSPDRVDSCVWAMTELMVEHQNDGIIQFYREQVDTAKAMRAALNAPPDPAMFVRLRCPPNISTVYGAKGNPYLADADGCVRVAPADVGPLRAAGFFEVAGELKNTA